MKYITNTVEFLLDVMDTFMYYCKSVNIQTWSKYFHGDAVGR